MNPSNLRTGEKKWPRAMTFGGGSGTNRSDGTDSLSAISPSWATLPGRECGPFWMPPGQRAVRCEPGGVATSFSFRPPMTKIKRNICV